MIFTRREDWPHRLNAAIEAARDKPFEWGEHDCLLFAASVVEQMTGVDPLAQWRGTYSTAHGALLALRRSGFKDIVEVFHSSLGPGLDSVLMAQRGDIVLYRDAEGRPGTGICIGEAIAAVTPVGLGVIPLADGLTAWRV
jgi:hypothetical protein